MEIQTVDIVCDAVSPNDERMPGATLRFKLSGPDTDATSGRVVSSRPFDVLLEDDGSTTVPLWLVDLGANGRHYIVHLITKLLDPIRYMSEPLGVIQPKTDSLSYSLRDLLIEGAVSAPDTLFYLLSEAQYHETIEAATAAVDAATAAATSAGAAASSASTATTAASTATTKAGEAASSASTAVTAASTATTKAGEAASSASAASTAASTAVTSASEAGAARDAAFVNADVYDNTAAGLSATSNGEQFQVADADEIVRYKNDSGSAVEVARYPSAAIINDVRENTAGVASSYALSRTMASRPTLEKAAILADFTRAGYATGGRSGVKSPVGFSGLFTFTRASTATYFDENGVLKTTAIDEPRFDHDPDTGDVLGVIVEPTSSTNTAQYSVPTSANWVASNCAITDAYAAAPDGTNDAALIVSSGSARAHSNMVGTIDANTIATVSCFVKASPNGGTNSAAVASSFAARFGVEFDFNTETAIPYTSGGGQVLSNGAGGYMCGAIPCGNGVWRLWATGKSIGGLTNRGLISLGYSLTGTPSTEVIAWGMQVETGLLSSYIPTSGASGTRAADSLYIDGAKVSEVMGGSMPASVSLYACGYMTYYDSAANRIGSGTSAGDATFWTWLKDSGNWIMSGQRTNGSAIGQPFFGQKASGTETDIFGGVSEYIPGVNVPFAAASRHGASVINGATNGVALTENTSPIALPDLSASSIRLGYTGAMTISQFALFTRDIGDTKLAEITA